MDSFSNRLKEALQIKGMKQTELAKKTGIDKSLISNYASGNYKAKQNNLYLMAQALDVSEAWLMGYDVDPARTPDDERSSDDDIFSYDNILPLPKMKKVPMLGNVACGEPLFAEQNIDGHFPVPEELGADFCLRAKGDSMTNARIFDGDIVFVHQQPMVEDGEIAVILIDDEATIKRVYYDRENGFLTLVPENPLYKVMRFQGEQLNQIRILGKVIAGHYKI